MPSKVLNTKDAVAYLGTSMRTIYRLATSGQMPAAKVGGRWRFHVDALDRCLISLSESNLVQNNPNKIKGGNKKLITGSTLPAYCLH